MNHTERSVIVLAGLIGFTAIWYSTDHQSAGWGFLAGIAVIGECANALATRLDKMRRAIELGNVLRGKTTDDAQGANQS